MPGIRRCGSYLRQHGLEVTDDEISHLMEILHDLACRFVDAAMREMDSEHGDRDRKDLLSS